MSTIPNLDGFDVYLPVNVDAEKTILGAILLDNGAYYEAASRIEADDFSLDSHRRIFQCMSRLIDAHHAVDIVTLAEELNQRKEVAAIGGVAYLASLTEGLPRRPVISEYLLIVKDKSMARRLMTICSATITRAADQSETAQEVASSVVEQIEGTLEHGWRTNCQGISEIIGVDGPRFEEEANQPSNTPLGASLFTADITRITCGIQFGELCLLCARPGQGKTEAAIQAAVENARRGLRVHMHSLEMQAHQIVRRMCRYIAKVPVAHMRDPRCLTPDERGRIRQARKELADLPISIDDTHELTVSDYRCRCALAAKRGKADLIITDYAQLLLVPRAKNALEEAKKQAETLRHIARDYCRTLALAQLRRAPPNDLNRYPDIEDIYGSSAFEQAAQMILLLHRTRENKKYTGEDFCFLGKMRELPKIGSFQITTEPWGAFRDGSLPSQPKPTQKNRADQSFYWQDRDEEDDF
jgi:replicative DNA helicase